MAEQVNAKTDKQECSVVLWAGVIGAPLVWAVQFQANYALVPKVCGSRSHVVLHVVAGIGALLALAAAVLSWRDFVAAGRGSPDATDGGPIARARFLGALGAATALLFAVLIVAQGIAAFFIDPCWN